MYTRLPTCARLAIVALSFICCSAGVGLAADDPVISEERNSEPAATPSGGNRGKGDTTADAAAKNKASQAEEAIPAGAVRHCSKLNKDHPDWYVVTFNGKTQLFSLGREYTYSSAKIRLCIENPDFRFRYRVSATYSDLPPLDSKDLLTFVEGKLAARDKSTSVTSNSVAQNLVLYENRLVGYRKELMNIISLLTGAVFVGRPEAAEIEAATNNEKLLLLEVSEQLGKNAQEIKRLRDQQPPPDADAKKELDALATRTQELIATADKLVQLARAIVGHLDDVRNNVYTVRSLKDKEAEALVTGERLKLTESSGTLVLGYGERLELGRQKFQIRSLSYVRYSLGVIYSSLRSQTVSQGFNAVGAPVLQVNTDLGIVPMFFMSHYWCGVDERELHPWYSSDGHCRWANTFAPTFAIGLPLSINPLKNLFIGLLWQPVPAFAATFGMHLGEISALRADIVPGMAPLPSSTGFRLQDAVENVVRVGLFGGLVITDAVFSRLIRNSIQK